MYPAQGPRLDSWKAIADYLDRNVRTVTRWAHERELPIHRVPGGKRHAVFAYTYEIDAWLNGQRAAAVDTSGQSQTVESYPNKVGTAISAAEITAPPTPQSSDSWSLSSLVPGWRWAIVAIAVILASTIWFSSRFFARSGTPAVSRPFRLAQLTDDGRLKQNLRTHGRTLYFDEYEGIHEVLMSAPMQGGPPHSIPTPFTNASLQDVSNDGKTLLVLSFEGIEVQKPLWLLPLNGGAPRLVGDLMCSSARWSPDNRRIACARGTNIFVANSDGSAARIVGSFSTFPGNVVWSPDGTRLRFLLYDQLARTASSWEITLPQNIATAASAPARLNLGPSCCADWSWTRNGQSFAYTRPDSNGILSLAVRSEKRSLFDRFPYESKLPLKVGEIVSLAPGKTEDSLFIISKSTSRGDLLKFDARHKTLQVIFNGLSVDYLFFSRDGHWMTYVDRLDRSLWRSKDDGTQPLQLTKLPMDVQLAAWSPDGHQIAFMGKLPHKPWRIFLISRDGGSPQEAALGDDNQGAPTWSPDGKSIVYANVLCQDTQSCWVRRIDLSTGKVGILPDSQGLRTARWSRDGKYIAALQPEMHQLMLFDFQAQRWKLIADSVTGDDINWSRDSQFLFTNNPQMATSVIERISVKDGTRSTALDLGPLQKMPGSMSRWFGLSPDDSIILLHLSVSSEIYALDWSPR